jgi:hypothetical protein
MAKPVRQLMHLNVGFAPPIVLGPDGTLCPVDRSSTVVARMSPGGLSGFRPDREFLNGLATAFSLELVADAFHGMTIRFGYDRYTGPSNPQALRNDSTRNLDPSERRLLIIALGSSFPLPARAGRDTVHLEISFGPRCEIMFSAPALHDVVMMRPQGDGMIRIATGHEAYNRHLVREPERTMATVPAGVFRQFVDSVTGLLPRLDTAGTVANGPDHAPDAPMFGTEDGLGLNMWLSRTGWIRAGFLCGRPGMGQSRFLEVPPSDFARFRDAALEAAQRAEMQPAWVAREGRAYLEHELTCHPVPNGHHPLPVLDGPERKSIETVVQIIVDENGIVDSSGVEVIRGLDSVTHSSLMSVLRRWTFQPAVANGRRVRARTHLNLILHPPESDAIVLANLTRNLTVSDTMPRTVFYQPTAPPPNVAPVITPNGLRHVLPLFLAYVQRARSSWSEIRSRFLTGLALGSELVVTMMIEDNLGNSSFVFVRVERIVGSVISGRIWQDIRIASDWKRGDPFTLAEGDILDWLILGPAGTTEGNFLGRFLGQAPRLP